MTATVISTRQPQAELLVRVRTEAVKLIEDYHAATDALSNTQLNWKPETAKWSIAEVFVHLNKQEGPYPSRIEAALARAPRRAENATFRSGFLGKTLTGFVKPGGKPVHAPKMLQPSESSYDRSVVGEWFELQERFLEAIDKAEGIDLVKARVAWVVTPLIRFRLGDLFIMLVAHKQRHLEQIYRVRNAEGFPEN